MSGRIEPGDMVWCYPDGRIEPVVEDAPSAPPIGAYLSRLPVGRDAKTGELVYSGLRGENVSPWRVAAHMTGGGIIGLLLGLAWQHFHR